MPAKLSVEHDGYHVCPHNGGISFHYFFIINCVAKLGDNWSVVCMKNLTWNLILGMDFDLGVDYRSRS